MTEAGPEAARSVDGADELRRFVTEALGCGCPDEVLARIRVEHGDGGEPGLDVGGRLLVRVVSERGLDELIRNFPDTVEGLRAERDRRGFNRLRLVVVRRSAGPLEETLSGMLGLVSGSDGRVHVHVVPPESVPAVLLAPGRDSHPRGLAS